MDLVFTTNDAKMNVSLEEGCNVFEIWNNDHWNVIHLSEDQLKELKKILNIVV